MDSIWINSKCHNLFLTEFENVSRLNPKQADLMTSMLILNWKIQNVIFHYLIEILHTEYSQESQGSSHLIQVLKPKMPVCCQMVWFSLSRGRLLCLKLCNSCQIL